MHTRNTRDSKPITVYDFDGCSLDYSSSSKQHTIDPPWIQTFSYSLQALSFNMAGPLANLANGVSKFFGKGKDTDGDFSMTPPPSAAIAAANGYGGVSSYNALTAAAARAAAEASRDIYTQFKNMTLSVTAVAKLRDVSIENARNIELCRVNPSYPATSNWLTLRCGFFIADDGTVGVISPRGTFYQSIAHIKDAYLGKDGYMATFVRYVRATFPDEYNYLLNSRRARKWFWSVRAQCVVPLSNITITEPIMMAADGEDQDASDDHKHAATSVGDVDMPAAAAAATAAAAAGALDTRSASALVAARAKKKEEIKARTEAMRRRYASGESVGQLVRVGGESRLAAAQPLAQKTLAIPQADQLSDALALLQLGSETSKAAAQKGDKEEGKAARVMQRSGAAQIRAVAAGWAGAMTYVNVKTAVAVNVGLIWILDGQCERTVSHPVYVVADDDNKNWYIVKLDTFNQMRSIGRRTTTRYEATRRVKIAGAGDLPIEVVPLMPSTIYAAAGNTGRESDNLADAYSAQLDVIKFEHGRNTVAAATAGSSPFVPRSA